eukprot:7477774-Alexandrium_andersonii.AAC.1
MGNRCRRQRQHSGVATAIATASAAAAAPTGRKGFEGGSETHGRRGGATGSVSPAEEARVTAALRELGR